MSLPVNWVITGIDDTLLPFENGQTLRQGWSPQCERFPAQTDNDWGVLKTTAIQDGEFQPEHNKQLPAALSPDPLLEVETGDLLLTCAGPRVRCGVICLVRMTRSRLMISGKMYRFRPEPRLVVAAYLEAFLRFHDTKKLIDAMKTGISDSGLNLTLARFKTLQVPLPPFAEQQRIVAKIEELFSELDKGIEHLKLARAQLAVYRQALLKHAFEGKLTADWRATHAGQLESAEQLLDRIRAERRRRWEAGQLQKHIDSGKVPPKDLLSKYKAPAEPDKTKLPPLPIGWRWVSVEQISTKVVDGVHKKPNYVGAGVPFVTVRNLTAGPGISFERLNFITPEAHSEFIKRANPEKGDILVSKDGTLGVVRAIECDTVFSIFVSVAMIKLVLPEMSRFVTLSLTSPQVQAQMVPKGSGLVHIHLEELRQDCVPLAPAQEQGVIVEVMEEQLSLLRALEADIDTNLQKSEALRQSILKKAFAGELVPQDPNDQPAAALLSRIRAERTKQAAVPKSKKQTRAARA